MVYTTLKKEEISLAVSKAKEGNQKAFSTLLDANWNNVYGFQLKRTENENDAEDITIQTFAKAFDKLDSYKDEYEFTTWLITISKNVHIDMVRKRKKSMYGEKRGGDAIKSVLDDSPTAEDRLISEQNLTALQDKIKQLKVPYQEVINLRYFGEMSYAQIAEELEEPINNVKVKLLRAKRLLAELIRRN